MRVRPFEDVVAEHGATVLRVCRAVVGPVDAEDAWSETFLSALRAYPELPADANVEAWLVTIAHRRALDVGRARSRRAIPVESPPDRPSARADPAARYPDLWAALQRLPDKQRLAVAYHHIAGLPFAEQFGDLGVRQPGDVVVGHGLTLFGGQPLQRRPQVGIAYRRIGVGRRAIGQRVGGRRRRRDRARPTSRARRCAMVTSHASTLASAGRFGIGAQRGQESLRPGVLGIDGPDDGAAHPQHGRAVLGHHVLERSHPHIMKTPRRFVDVRWLVGLRCRHRLQGAGESLSSPVLVDAEPCSGRRRPRASSSASRMCSVPM